MVAAVERHAVEGQKPARDRRASSLIHDFVQIIVDVDNAQTEVALLFEPLLIRGRLCAPTAASCATSSCAWRTSASVYASSWLSILM